MKTILILLFTCTLAWAITAENVTVENVNLSSIQPVLVTMGDSLTTGDGSTDDWGYRKNLQEYMSLSTTFRGEENDPNPNNDAPYIEFHSGVGGEDAADIEARMQTNLDNHLSDSAADKGIVLLHSGSNDDKSTAGGRETARDNVEDTIDLIHAHNANIDVYVALITPRNAADDTDYVLFNGILNTMLETYQETKSNLYIVDMHTAFTEDTWGFCSGDYSANCFADTNHLNDTGYQAMARQWFECILSEVGRNCNGN